MESRILSSLANLTRRRSGSQENKVKDGNKPSVPQPAHPLRFELVAESPPALLLGTPEQSSGALYACKLLVTIASDKAVTLTTLHVKLSLVFTTNRPVGKDCPECTSQTKVLKEWNLLSQPRVFSPGDHVFPLSYLIPGKAYTTIKARIGSIEYLFQAKATPNDFDDALNFSKPLFVNRALRRSRERNSRRAFPPTDFTLNATLPTIIFPTGVFNVSIRIKGVTTMTDDGPTRWRPLNLDWTLIEVEKVVSPACAQHAKLVSGPDNGVAHEISRDLAAQKLRRGWKTDFSSDEIECEFSCPIDSTARANTTMTDARPGSRMYINHWLSFDMILAEEWVPQHNPNRPIPTGNAKRIRTRWAMTVSARSGMGVAWDDEQPPLYQDVPASPPVYFQQVEDYDGDELNNDVERLQLEA